MPKKAIVLLAEGFEEIEAVTPIDILRRAEVETEVVGLDATEVTGAHGITFQADRVLNETEQADAIILPGGLPGAENLAASETLAAILKAQTEAGRIVAAICAAPAYVLAPLGLLDGREATCFPACQERLAGHANYVEKPVVQAENIITSRGPGTAMAFGIALVQELVDFETADEQARRMLYSR
jgi:4-methyl-5(b-hydroxyethyl)-thiazole monophosphate biosynthesis